MGQAQRPQATRQWGAVLLAGASLLLAACHADPPPAPYPHESLLGVLAELRIHLARDPYRFAPGTDLDGRNIYRLTLGRLEPLEEALGREFADTIAFAGGRALERLGEWRAAAEAFERAAQYQTQLTSEALTRGRSARRMHELTDRTWFAADLNGYLNELAVTEHRLEGWAAKRDIYAAFVSSEHERARVERIRLLLRHRMLLPDAAGRCRDLADGLIQRHTESWRIHEHWLLLGEVHETLARDLTERFDPAGAGFDAAGPWQAHVEAARQAYRRVARADGDPFKPEGQGRLRALDAYSRRVLSLAR